MKTLLVISAVIVVIVLTAIVTTKRVLRKVTYMIDALEDGETNFRYDENRLWGRHTNRILNRLRGIFEKEKRNIIDSELYYGLILDHVRTGIVVMENTGKSRGIVRYSNVMALNMIGISSLSNIKQIGKISPELQDAFFNVSVGREERASFYNESGLVMISLTASDAVLGGRNVKVVAMNDISSEMAENEQASWTKLIRVLTHEVMNTLAPITSLSETLSERIAGRHDVSGNGSTILSDDADIISGLDTIASSSRGLVKFVESYRTLTRVAQPVRKSFLLKELVERVIHLTSDSFTSAGATCRYAEKTDDILLYADENQLSQILVNLLKNAIQSGASEVVISAEIDASESVIINVANNGSPISPENFEQIFVPFFTTRQSEGTGIGLSLSRQIMRMHGGTLRLTKSDASSTVFTLCFR
ncbi:MAG: sensor histidine kinase [Candidatus Cryptobacteroides sp.]